jgi:TonB family protein
MLDAKPRREDKQLRRLSIALVLLLSALIVVLVKDRDYWFGGEETTATEEAQPAAAPSTPAEVPSGPVTKAPQQAEAKHAVRPAVARNLESPATKSQWGPATTAAEHVRVAPLPASLEQPVDSSYPLLAGQMAVQGSVLLQALIAADGAVEDLRVLSGPTILASAAREAVRQWRFKPFYQDGKPVETQARVTVNFTIKVTDTTARYQPTSITADGAL